MAHSARTYYRFWWVSFINERSGGGGGDTILQTCVLYPTRTTYLVRRTAFCNYSDSHRNFLHSSGIPSIQLDCQEYRYFACVASDWQAETMFSITLLLVFLPLSPPTLKSLFLSPPQGQLRDSVHFISVFCVRGQERRDVFSSNVHNRTLSFTTKLRVHKTPSLSGYLSLSSYLSIALL